MEKETLARLFHALRGGELRKLSREGSKIQFRVTHPELAGSEHPEWKTFFAALNGVREFSLQPFRNESITVTDLNEIARLGVILEHAEAVGERVVVLCKHQGAASGARLTIRADRLEVWNEEFDGRSSGELEDLRLGAGN